MMRQGVLLGFLFLLKFIGCLAEENLTADYAGRHHVGHHIDPVPTRLSSAEKTCIKIWNFIQRVMDIDKDDSRRIESFIYDLPESIQEIIMDLQESTLRPDDIWEEFWRLIHGIFPNTRWCGIGNMASDEDQLGHCEQTDSCCRDHDHCRSSIEAGHVKHHLKNIGFFPRSLCECDRAFYKCLKRADSVTSSLVGWTYFNLLSPQCFKKEHPIVRCQHKDKISAAEVCTKYKLNKRRRRIWQWFDNPLF